MSCITFLHSFWQGTITVAVATCEPRVGNYCHPLIARVVMPRGATHRLDVSGRSPPLVGDLSLNPNHSVAARSQLRALLAAKSTRQSRTRPNLTSQPPVPPTDFDTALSLAALLHFTSEDGVVQSGVASLAVTPLVLDALLRALPAPCSRGAFTQRCAVRADTKSGSVMLSTQIIMKPGAGHCCCAAAEDRTGCATDEILRPGSESLYIDCRRHDASNVFCVAGHASLTRLHAFKRVVIRAPIHLAALSALLRRPAVARTPHLELYDVCLNDGGRALVWLRNILEDPSALPNLRVIAVGEAESAEVSLAMLMTVAARRNQSLQRGEAIDVRITHSRCVLTSGLDGGIAQLASVFSHVTQLTLRGLTNFSAVVSSLEALAVAPGANQKQLADHVRMLDISENDVDESTLVRALAAMFSLGAGRDEGLDLNISGNVVNSGVVFNFLHDAVAKSVVPTIVSLTCGNGPEWRDDSPFAALAQLVSASSSSVRNLRICGVGAHIGGLSRVLVALKRSGVEALSVDVCGLEGTEVRHISNVFSARVANGLPCPKTLSLVGNVCVDLGALAPALLHLTALDLGRNVLRDQTVGTRGKPAVRGPACAPVLSNATVARLVCLRRLSLEDCGICNEVVLALARHGTRNAGALEFLDVSRNSKVTDGKALSSLLTSFQSSITFLSCHSCPLETVGVASILEAVNAVDRAGMVMEHPSPTFCRMLSGWVDPMREQNRLSAAPGPGAGLDMRHTRSHPNSTVDGWVRKFKARSCFSGILL
jgi:hypothetical protein